MVFVPNITTNHAITYANFNLSEVPIKSPYNYMELIAVIAVAPTGKASFVFSYMETGLKGQNNEE